MSRKEFVNKMFTSIAPNYDKANKFLTFGLDFYWRTKLVQLSNIKDNSTILDCATGTGKLAFSFGKKLSSNGRVYGIDFCQKMLDQIKNNDSRISFKKADVLHLPFINSFFDVTSIAYGLRNLSDLEKGLEEMARVTKSKGYVMVLETGTPSSFITAFFLSLYMRNIVPMVGGWITGNKLAYKYLHESSLNFPSGKQLISIFEKTNCYQKVECFPLFLGASYIYKAVVK